MTSLTTQKSNGMKFGLIFFSSSEASFSGETYRLVIESTKFADGHGFSSVWIPERHFTKDGWLYPNPAVLQAALARETRHIHLRAGSVVMPLHNAIRVAEEWAMVDNLSGGRVGISFASGWHPNDFVFFPEKYSNRHEEMYRGIQTIQKLWRGESIRMKGGDGNEVEIRIYPTPIQPSLPVWITAAGNPDTFVKAGAIGANLLTHLFNQSFEELAEKIQMYRAALTGHGYNAEERQVSLMLHTFVGDNLSTVLEQVRGSFCNYLRSASYLFNAIAYSRGQKIDIASMSEKDINDYIDFVFERLVSTERVLFGTPETCFKLIEQLKAIGVDEVACQLDFGVDIDLVLKSLPFLNQLKERCNSQPFVKPSSSWAPAHNQVISSASFASDTPFPQRPPDLGQQVPPARQQNLLADIQARCSEEISAPEFYRRLYKQDIQFGASFQGIERLFRRNGEALGLVRVLETLEQDAQGYNIHPAFLDACFQVLIATLPPSTISNGKGQLHLPTGLRSFQIHKQPGRRVWSHATLSNPGERQGIFEGDVFLLDEEGQVLVEALGLRLQSSERAIERDDLGNCDDWLFEQQWLPEEHAQEWPVSEGPRQSRVGTWLIFADKRGIGEELAAILAAQGERCIRVWAGEAYEQLNETDFRIRPEREEDMQEFLKVALSNVQPTCKNVVHLWSLNALPPQETTLDSLERSTALGCESTLHFVQSLIRLDLSEQPALWLVTQGAQAITGDTTQLAVAQAPLWGFGRTLAHEHPDLWGGLVDLDPRTPESSAAQLYKLVKIRGKEDQLAFRQGQCYVPRFVRKRELLREVDSPRLRSDSSYLITGGLGDLGLLVARWMVEQGARRLVLLGRMQLPPRSRWTQVEKGSRLANQIASIQELESMGTSIYLAPVDVANEEQMNSFLEAFRREGQPPIRGVVHMAAVVQGATLLNLDGDALRMTLRPKMLGGWLLHCLFKDTPLDFFVLFSAIPSLLGWLGRGAANYAAANTFLDALAHHRRASAYPALSINWGPWDQAGLAARAKGGLERLAKEGIGSILPRQGLEVLGRLLQLDLSQIAVVACNWQHFFQAAPEAAESPLLSQLVLEAATDLSRRDSSREQRSSIREELFLAEPAERQRLFEDYIRERVAKALGLPLPKLNVHQPLTDLGLDSLMAIELKNRIELEMGVRVPIIALLQGPSIAQLSTQILDQLAEESLVATASSTLTVLQDESQQEGSFLNGSDADQLLAKLDQLSDEEVDTLLSDMLQEELDK